MVRNTIFALLTTFVVFTCDNALAAFRCPSWFARIGETFSRSKSQDFSVHLEPSELQLMREVRRSRVPKPYIGPGGVEIAAPKLVKIDSKTFNIVEQLGGGDEGIVYRALDEDGTSVAIKMYFFDRHEDLGHRRLVAAQKAGIPTIADSTTAWDRAHLTAVYRYVDGLSVDEINRSTVIPQAVKEKVAQKFEEWEKHYCSRRDRYSSCGKRNIVFDFDSGSFYLIDAF